jgi:hypothetical protein
VSGGYVYIRTEPELWTAGAYGPDGKFQPESDHGSPAEAAQRVAYLNGGPVSGDAALADAARLLRAEAPEPADAGFIALPSLQLSAAPTVVDRTGDLGVVIIRLDEDSSAHIQVRDAAAARAHAAAWTRAAELLEPPDEPDSSCHCGHPDCGAC